MDQASESKINQLFKLSERSFFFLSHFPFFQKLINMQNSAALRHSFAHNQWAKRVSKISALYNWKQDRNKNESTNCFQLYKPKIFWIKIDYWLCANECLWAAEFWIIIIFFVKGEKVDTLYLGVSAGHICSKDITLCCDQ